MNKIKEIARKFYSDLQAGRTPSWIIAVGLAMIIGYLLNMIFFAASTGSSHALIAGAIIGLGIGVLAAKVEQTDKAFAVIACFYFSFTCILPIIFVFLMGFDWNTTFCDYCVGIIIAYVIFGLPISLRKKPQPI